MSKILFINPVMESALGVRPYDSKLMKAIWGGRSAFIPKLVGMIIAALTPEKYTFQYIDEDVDEIDYESDADLVVITCMTVQAIRTYEISGEFRKRGKTVIIGGIHAAVMTEEVLAHCDVAMIGECENTWPVMLEDFENGRLKRLYDAKEFPPVEQLISPKVDIINPRKFLYYPIQATRGCPYNCEFCSIEYSSGNRYRMKPVSQVVNEILAYRKFFNEGGFAGVYEKGFYFVDDNLYVNREYVKELLTALIPLKIEWDGQGTANVANDDEILQLLADSGCRSFSIGLESIVPESLQEMNKSKSTNNIESYKSMISNIARKGIIPGGYFVFGFDSDDISVFRRTLDFISETDLVENIYSMLTPYLGTRLYERIKSRIFNTSHFLYNSWCCVYTPKNVTTAQLYKGLAWIGQSSLDFGFMRKQLQKFWNYGPWKNKRRMTAGERIMLAAMGIRLLTVGMPGYANFAFWAAFNRKTKDFKTIVWVMRRHEIAWLMPKSADPAVS